MGVFIVHPKIVCKVRRIQPMLLMTITQPVITYSTFLWF